MQWFSECAFWQAVNLSGQVVALCSSIGDLTLRLWQPWLGTDELHHQCFEKTLRRRCANWS
jgi:hypothetical protein